MIAQTFWKAMSNTDIIKTLDAVFMIQCAVTLGKSCSGCSAAILWVIQTVSLRLKDWVAMPFLSISHRWQTIFAHAVHLQCSSFQLFCAASLCTVLVPLASVNGPCLTWVLMAKGKDQRPRGQQLAARLVGYRCLTEFQNGLGASLT